MAFPTTGVLDTFNRGNESPLAAPWAGPIIPFTNQLKIVSAKCVADTAAGGMYRGTFGVNEEAYVTISVLPVTFIPLMVYVGLVNMNTASLDGYEGFYADPGDYRIRRYDNNVPSTLATFTDTTLASGDGVGLGLLNTTLTIYKRIAGVWTAVGSFVDATYTLGGAIGLGINDTTGAVTNFGGGTVVAGGTSGRSWIL